MGQKYIIAIMWKEKYSKYMQIISHYVHINWCNYVYLFTLSFDASKPPY